MKVAETGISDATGAGGGHESIHPDRVTLLKASAWHSLGHPAPGLTASSMTQGATTGLQPKAEIVSIAALVVLAFGILWWRWVGYQGHDDASYASAAMSWVEHFPPLGTTHWALRYPLVLPAAGMIALFGPSVVALTTVNLASYAFFLIIGYLALRRWFGWGTAALGALISILLPQFPVQATYANPDLPEMALSIASFWALMLARDKGGAAGWLLASGIFAGIGFQVRETAILLVPLFGFLFLIRPAMPRWRYLLIALGFVAVVGAQCAYFAARTGDPLYRQRISAHHDVVDRTAKGEIARRDGHALDSEGVLTTNLSLAPFSAIFVSQKYGLLFFLALPAYVFLLTERAFDRRQRDVLNWTSAGAVIAFLFIALNSSILYVVPRYFMVSAAFAIVPVAVLTASWLQLGKLRRSLALLAMLGFVTSSIGLLYLENVEPMGAERRIVEFVRTAPTLVHIDPETWRRINYMLLSEGLLDRASAMHPDPGDLVATEDGVVNECLQSSDCGIRAKMVPFAPGPGWIEIMRVKPPRRAIAKLLTGLGLDTQIPPDILRKITQPGATAVVYRVE